MTVDRLAAFTAHQPRLFGIAYRMLGSVADAEDLVQETFVRWQKSAPVDVKSPEAWLTTVVTRLCLNHLSLARVQREEPVGTWLPEPIVAEDAVDPRENAELADSLSVAFLVILERLTPTERAVYLLREIFGYAFSEVAEIVHKSEANCRQLLARARQSIAERRPRFKPSPELQRRLVDAFLKAATAGDFAGLNAVLAEDVTFVVDRGGPGATREPMVGRSDVARVFVEGAIREQAAATITRPAVVNGLPGFVTYRGETLRAAVAFDVEGEQIRAIYLIADPRKLRRVAREREERKG